MSRLRSCMSSVTMSSSTSRIIFSFSVRKLGMMPVTRPPLSSVARATSPIRPRLPPP